MCRVYVCLCARHPAAQSVTHVSADEVYLHIYGKKYHPVIKRDLLRFDDTEGPRDATGFYVSKVGPVSLELTLAKC